VNDRRRFSEAISEGDGISVIAEVAEATAAASAATAGAEALLVYSGREKALPDIVASSSLPILFYWDGEQTDVLAEVDACILGMGDWRGDLLDHAHNSLDEDFELVFRIEDEDQLREALERFDPEIFVLACSRNDPGDAFEHVLDLLPDVPAGKLAIAELPNVTRDEVGALERAGFDGVIAAAAVVRDIVSAEPPDV
jgi:hypothetical protein